MDFSPLTNFTGSETQAPDDMTNLEATYDSPPALAQECKSFNWKVQVIDNDGNIESKMMTVRDVWKLQSCRVIVHFDEDNGQPDEDSGGLLGSWLGQLSNDVNLLPINYADWRKVAPHIKDRAWDVIRTKFWFDEPATRRDYVMGVLGSRCNGVKVRLWKEYKHDDRSQTLENRPENVPEDQWRDFVYMRFTDKWKKMQERNTKNQKNNTMPHLSGRKSFSRRRREIKIKTGKTPTRGELFVATRTKADESFVSAEAQTRVEALKALPTQSSTPQFTSNVAASLEDDYAQVFGPERPGRIRCVGRGPTPSKLFKRCTATRLEVENSEVVVQMKRRIKGLEDENKTLTMFIQRVLGTRSADEASASIAKFAAAVTNIPNPTNSQEMGGNVSGNQDQNV